jgi:hypothetical protein
MDPKTSPKVVVRDIALAFLRISLGVALIGTLALIGLVSRPPPEAPEP